MAERSGAVIECSSRLAADADTVWARVATMEGVNAELMPLVRMTAPKGASLRELAPEQLGRPVLVSWLLGFGLIPFDRHVLVVEAIGERSFVERSHSLAQRVWRHERRVVPDGTGSIVSDRVEAVPRIGLLTGAVGFLVRRIFAHRHRRLVALYGAR